MNVGGSALRSHPLPRPLVVPPSQLQDPSTVGARRGVMQRYNVTPKPPVQESPSAPSCVSCRGYWQHQGHFGEKSRMNTSDHTVTQTHKIFSVNYTPG